MGFTKQETFDLVFTHLFEQGERAVDATINEYCQYRASHGRKCAVGCLIPDSEYTDKLEDYLPFVSSNNELTRLLHKLGHDIMLCSALQGVHDRALNWNNHLEGLLYSLRVVAKDHDLRF